MTSGYLFEQAMNSKRPPKLVPDSVLNKDLDLLARWINLISYVIPMPPFSCVSLIWAEMRIYS